MPWIDELPAEIADTISDEIRTSETMNKYKSLGEALKGHVELQSHVGNSIRVPGPDAGEEDRKKFYQKLIDNAPDLMMKPDLSEPEQAENFYKLAGRPDEAAGYTRPENAKIDENVESELRDVLFEAGVSDAQFQKIINRFSAAEMERQETMQSVNDAAMSDLKAKWGLTIDERINAAQQINEEFYPGRPFSEVSPKEIESLYAIYQSTTGKGPTVALQEGSSQGMTPAEAEERADEIMRRIHDPKSNLSHEEKMKLQKKRMDMLVKYAGREGTIDSLRH